MFFTHKNRFVCEKINIFRFFGSFFFKLLPKFLNFVNSNYCTIFLWYNHWNLQNCKSQRKEPYSLRFNMCQYKTIMYMHEIKVKMKYLKLKTFIHILQCITDSSLYRMKYVYFPSKIMDGTLHFSFDTS